VLVEAFGRAGRAALGRVVLSTQRQLVSVRAAGRLLVLDVLHYLAQVRGHASWEAHLAPCLASEAEQELAGQLIALASAPLDWARYRDTSAAELAALIAAKRAQQPPPALPEEPVVLKLLDALKQSVAAACAAAEVAVPKGRKPPGRRVTG
jgi:non-homologous end joining protein Ku